jgi:hypothetical protein
MSVPSTNVSSEVKRMWPIAAWVAILAVVAAAATIGIAYQRMDGQRTAARLIVDHELTRHHWTALESDQQFRPVIHSISKGSPVSQSTPQWAARFIGTPTKPGAGLDAFEVSGVAQIQNGADEVWDESAFTVTRYVRAIRANQDCIACHPVRSNGGFIKVDDVIGIISVDFRHDRRKLIGPLSLGTGRN